MNEYTAVYRKEYVDHALELLKQSLKELEESSILLENCFNQILNENEFPFVEQQNHTLADNTPFEQIKEIEIETKTNTDLIETSAIAMEKYTKEDYSYQNPETGTTPNPKIPNGPVIAALAGLGTIGLAALSTTEEEKEKVEG